ncbi:MAG: hypothetical protein ACFFAN_12615 [Promethearchaeota archaeon]
MRITFRNGGTNIGPYSPDYGGFNGLEFLGNSNIKVKKLRICKTFQQIIKKI